MPDPVQSDPRVYLAAERTLLAWVRTGLAMMGFGFVVARFGLFLRATAALHAADAPRQLGVSHWVGVTLVILGVGVNVGAAVSHRRIVARLDRGEGIRLVAGSLGFVVAIALAGLGVFLASYLVWSDTTG
jgi:inner membrane protein YidH